MVEAEIEERRERFIKHMRDWHEAGDEEWQRRFIIGEDFRRGFFTRILEFRDQGMDRDNLEKLLRDYGSRQARLTDQEAGRCAACVAAYRCVYLTGRPDLAWIREDDEPEFVTVAGRKALYGTDPEKG
jgi:hypothetical protein